MISEHDLRKIYLLKDLPERELSNLVPLLRERHARRGSYILYVDDPGPSLLFIAEGEVKINLIGEDGKEIVLANLEEGEFFGEIAVLAGVDRSANVVAMSDCRLFVLSKEDFEKHILGNTGFALAMLRELALRLRHASSKIGDLALLDVYRRVARTLQSLGQVQELNHERCYVIEKRPTHQELAALVGTSREMVTRALKDLEADGCITLEGRNRVVLKRLPQ